MGIFERYLTLWVGLCIVAGVGLGNAAPGLFAAFAGFEVARVNLVGRGADLGDDLPDDGADRLRRRSATSASARAVCC